MIKNLSIDECLEVLGSNYIGRLGYVYGQSPFILPITYYHDKEEKCIISYSAEGHKLEAMRRYDFVALQVDEITDVQKWKSVLIHGRFEEVSGSDAKLLLHRFADGVRETLAQKGEKTPKFISDFSSKLEDRGLPIVYRIYLSEIIGKYRD